ncbi:MAG TPA: signal peptidase I [Thermoclostridium sp.]|nr:signal peptidase I [Clostridiaceae bacterium]HOQ75962.1 signal peptidase I [Thermoclostridium sp.]
MEKKQKKKSIGREILEWIVLILAAFLITSIIQSELYAITEVNMTSMMDTLVQGDKLIMSKLAYVSKEPQRGDIIIFLRDEPIGGFFGRMGIYISDVAMKLKGDFRRNRLIKRVIGVPGDKVEIRNNVLYINDAPVTEDYARIDPDLGIVLNGSMDPVVVRKGQLFVMGDNRGQSMDSRNFGVIELDWVEGKAIFRILPFDKFGRIE